MSKRNVLAVAAALLALAFLAGVYGLFRLRFESADAYPPYSTLRADPLGAKALFDSLAMQPGVTVSRSMRPLGRVEARDTTLFLLGISEWDAQTDLAWGMTKDLARFTRDGGRVVVALVPQRARPPMEVAIERQLREGTKPDKKESDKKRIPSLFETLGVTLVVETAKGAPPATEHHADLPRFTALWFAGLAPEWRVERTQYHHAVWIERPWQSGSIVFLADSWMLSNEALTHEPDAASLAGLAGASHKLVFDEAHLGLEEGGSVAGLLRRYRLQGLIVAFLALAGLYIWKSTSPLLSPVRVEGADGRGLTGFSAAAGLVTLLERSIEPPKLLEVCASEYRKAASASLAGVDRGKIEEILQHNASAADPVRGYESIRRALEEIRHPWKKPSSN